MGTWSRPLFAKVSSGNPDDWFIDYTDWPIARVGEWHHAAFLHDLKQTRLSLTEFMNTGFDTHKIMNHMSPEQIQRWLDLFRDIYTQNPTLEWVQFHFYCSDTKVPYYLTCRQSLPSVLEMAICESNSRYYLRRKRSIWEWFTHTAESQELFFDEKAYKAAQDRCIFRTLKLTSQPHHVWHYLNGI